MGNTSRLVKNTAFLYIRMAITMLIGLFSVRIVLRALGEVDYGVYNVVSGIVTMLAFLNNALASTTQRFLSYEIPNNNTQKLKEIFSTSFYLYLLLCVLIVIAGETVGLWFINTKLNIPADRMVAANWIYQFSIISFCFSVMSASYNAAIIAREKMQIYAYVSIVEAILKLSLLFLLLYLPGDKLIIYGLMMCVITIAIFIFDCCYCTSLFAECRLITGVDSSVLKKLGSFASWNIFGTLSNIFSGQGLNILLNVFFGVVVNTARGIAYQLDNAVNTLVQNFYMAVRPQIVKTISERNVDETNKLLRLSTIIGYCLFSCVAIVFIFETRTILRLWLQGFPELTVHFTRIVLVAYFFEVLITPLNMIISGTGKIKNFMLINGLFNIAVLPLSYLLLKLYPIETIPFYIILAISIIRWINALYQTKLVYSIDHSNYLQIVIRLFFITMISVVCILLLHMIISNIWILLVVDVITVLLVYMFLVWVLLLSSEEKYIIRSRLEKVIKFTR